MSKVKKIRVIEASNPFIFDAKDVVDKKLSVAAYARVSTDEDDQINSFSNQVNEYEKRIKSNDNWTFAGMYADKGISGTQIKRREGFKQMIHDAHLGKIDLILTKSISRFGRNTVEILETVRMLREINVTIYFEKENIYSNDTKLDFLLTVMSSIAQEESRSISENIKWSVQKRFKEGKVNIIPSNFLGYDKDEKGEIIIIEDEAEIIRLIFSSYINGLSTYEISKMLMKEGIKTIRGNTKWDSQSVLRIIQNEKYAGNAILQKTYTIDYLTGRRVVNNNIVDKYYVENSHPGIISKSDFNLVQEMIKKESYLMADTHKNSTYPLTNLVFCSSCKRPMKRHVHNHNRPSEKIVLNCNHAPKIKLACDQKVIDNDLVLSAIDDFTNNLLNTNKLNTEIISAIENNKNIDYLNAEIERLTIDNHNAQNELEKLVDDYKELIKEDPSKFDTEYKNIRNSMAKQEEQLSKLNMELSSTIINEHRIKMIEKHINNNFKLSRSNFIKTFIKIILVNPNNDLIIVLDNSPLKASEILNDFTMLDNSSLLLEKTHYDKELNKNITYKVVSINE